MTDLATVLRGSLDDEPPLGFDAEDVVRRGRRARQRRTAVLAGTSCALVAVAVAGAVAVRAPSTVRRLAPAATPSPAPLPDRVTKENVAAFTEQVLGVRLEDEAVRDDLPRPGPGGELFHLSSVVADTAGRGSLMVTVVEPGTLIHPVTCTTLTVAADGYEGRCEERTLSDGSRLVEREGRVPGEGYAMGMAVLTRPDGSGVMAQATNQDGPGRLLVRPPDRPTPPPVTRPDPPVDATELARLVLEIAPRTPSAE